MPREESLNPLVRFIAKVQRKFLYHRQWFVHIDRHASEPTNCGFHDGIDLFPPNDRFWADPFLWQHDGRCFVFVEELPFSAKKGHISVIECDESGQVLNCTKVLEEPWHLSYPYLFEWGGELWMLPESGHSRRVTLYRCESFPYRWVEAKVLMDNVRTADPTLIEHEGFWWLFINIAAEGESIHEHLHLFQAPTPLGPYTPHPRNPIRQGTTGVRSAGTPYIRDGVLYRPAQDCAGVYGRRTIVNRVDVMTAEMFSETECATIEPGWRRDVLRTHTLSLREGWRAVDALRWLPRWRS